MMQTAQNTIGLIKYTYLYTRSNVVVDEMCGMLVYPDNSSDILFKVWKKTQNWKHL